MYVLNTRFRSLSANCSTLKIPMALPLHIQSVTRRFGNLTALDGISLDIEAGELFFLLGPSGCGKTTLLRTIAGFCEPDRGSIFLGEREITRLPPHQRDAGMVFQSYALWPHLSVGENVAFGLQMRKVPAAEAGRRVTEVLQMVQMQEKLHAKPNELSGGQQQRVALARALVIHPNCLLLDEPLSNLDAKLRLEMRAEIRRICKDSSLTAVYVTHDQKEALSVADRLAVLNHGRIEQIGTPREVYQHPRSRFVAGFIGETNFLDATVLQVTSRETTVKTRFGELRGRGDNGDLKPGDAVTVSLRPEAIRLALDTTSDGANRITGRLHHTVYLGEVAQHLLTVDHQDESLLPLKVFELNPKCVARDQDQPVSACIDSEDVVILKHE